MAEKVVTKKSFIGGRMVYPGEKVDVDAKGEVIPADSTPVGQMTDDQLEATLKARRDRAKAEGKPQKREPEYGDNVADATEDNTGSQALAMAPVAPYAAGAVQPQGIPPGTEPHRGGFVHPAPADAPVAIEEVVSAEPEQSEAVEGVGTFDHDGDGKPGGAPKGGNKKK